MMQKRRIAFKLIVFILAGVSVIFLAIFGYNYLYSRNLIVKYVEENAKNLADKTVSQIDEVLGSVAKVPQNMAYFLENTSYTAEELNNFLRSVVQNNDEIYGATIAFEPYMFDPGKQRYAPYFYKDDKGQIHFRTLPTRRTAIFAGTGTRSPGNSDALYGVSPISTRGAATLSCRPTPFRFTG